MEDLARSRGPRRQALDTEEARVAPEQRHHPFCPDPGTDRREEHLGDRLQVEWADGRVDDEPEVRVPVPALFLHELIVSGRSPLSDGKVAPKAPQNDI